MPKSKSEHLVLQLKVTLRGSKPPIWRRIHVGSDTSLGELHGILQVVMGWQECHMHQFVLGGVYYGTPQPEFDFDVKDEDKITLGDIARSDNAKFKYEYDFGDGWEHAVVVEKSLPADAKTTHPVCVAGKRACPPEDCGGVWGFYEKLEIADDSDHPEHEEIAEWMGEDYDPVAFDIDEVNSCLRDLSENPRETVKW